MGVDAILKRYFPAIVCFLIATAAYFQASGLGQLVASVVAVSPSAMAAPPAPPPPAPALASSADHTTSAAAILSRNPFDSATGPLDGKPLELPSLASSAAPAEIDRDPYSDPPCDVAKVLMIVASDDPSWSFASIQAGDGKTVLRRQGDEVGSYTVQYIGDQRPRERARSDRRDLWDRVWLVNGSNRCQMQVGGKAPAPTAAPSQPATAGSASKDPGGKNKIPAELAAKIHKVSPTEFAVERSVVDAILENQADLMRTTRIVPEKENGKVVGVRMFGIRPDSVLGTLGLENGDRLSSINGFEMSDPQKALEAYAKLRTADRLTISINRGGKPMNIDFNIK